MLKILFFIGTALAFYSSSSLAGTVVIVQKDKKFSQTSIKVKVGDKIKFQNDDKDLPHNVYSLGPKNSFELQIQAPGQASEVTMKEIGKTQVECAIHPGMKLDVEVTK